MKKLGSASSPYDIALVDRRSKIFRPYKLSRFGLRYGRLVYRFRWPVIALWGIALLVCIPFARDLPTILTADNYIVEGGESAHVTTMLNQWLHLSSSPVLVVFRAQQLAASDPHYQQQVHTFVEQATALKYVSGVQPPQIGKDGHTVLVAVSFALDTSDAIGHQIPALRALVYATGPAQVWITGETPINQAFAEISQQDAEQIEKFTMPILLFALILIFGNLFAAMIPLLLAGVTVTVAMALIYGVALHTPTNNFVLNITSCIGLGVSIDASLLITRRFRDEMQKHASVSDAVAWTVATAGEAMLFSCLIVLIGFAGLFWERLAFMNVIGIGGMAVVLVAAVATLTLLPALLGIFGTKLKGQHLPDLIAIARKNNGNKGFWHDWAQMVMRRPVVTILLVMAALTVLGWPLFSIKVGLPTINGLPAQVEARQGMELIQAQYSASDISPLYVLVQMENQASALTPDNLAKIDNLTRWTLALPQVANVISLTHLPPPASDLTLYHITFLYSGGFYQQNPTLAAFVNHFVARDMTLMVVQMRAPLDTTESNSLIAHLRAHRYDASKGLRLMVGGAQASTLDFHQHLYQHFPQVIIFIMVMTYLLLLCMFRSLLLPLKAVLMNIISVGATCGVLVFVFQQGHLSNLLSFTSDGTIADIVPILLFCLLFGLSMDYEVFLLARIHEEWLATSDNHRAIISGLEKTAGVITSAATIFLVVGISYTFTRLLSSKELGFGIATAVLLESTIIRIILVPAMMSLLGKGNWWLPGSNAREAGPTSFLRLSHFKK